MRAEEPSISGSIERESVNVAYEVFGSAGPTIVLLPCWIIVHARSWKAQVADLAQDCRVIVIDGRGNGASDRPTGPEGYTSGNYALDALAVLDHLQVSDFVLIGFSSSGAQVALITQARPAHVKAAVLIGPVNPKNSEVRQAREREFLTPLPSYEGWQKYNACYIREHCAEFVQFFFERMFCEPHSTKQIEDAVSWASETTPQVLIDSVLGRLRDEADLTAAYRSMSCPVLLIHGTADEIVPISAGREVAALCSAELLEMEGSGHGPHLRHPAFVNDAIRQFLSEQRILPTRPSSTSRLRKRSRPRALYLSSPIGLGHARRDLAVARQLKLLRPELEVDWLAQNPLTHFLERSGEHCHEASKLLASESSHIEEESGEHDLNVFQALRSMDEILVRNFRVFQSVLEEGGYDLVIADEAWEVDHFWHEHPRMKRAPLVWMTDFVGFAPLAEGGDHEAHLTADYNREMVNHVEQNTAVRDRAIFVGNGLDVVDDTLGPDLPHRRQWVEERFAFSGYILGDDVPLPEERAMLRDRLGLSSDRKTCIVTVGGSGVGAALINRILLAVPLARRLHPELNFIVVTGPRLRSDRFPHIEGVEFRGFEPNLPRLMAACDLALVQGGLSTCMELAATHTPFIYFPLQRHFEQNIHVRHRLERYGAGRSLHYTEATPERIAAAISEELSKTPQAVNVERTGAACAAHQIAELL